ncbi:MAG: RIP metalloprotease RseP [Candidatus Acidiferrales bacterium]
MSHGWVGIVAAIAGLSVMVLVHEWGHYIVARWCGVRVDVFSIGFGKRIFGWKRGDTDFRVAPLLFGGYLKMAGDNPAEERSGAPDELLSQSRWKRFLITVAGPIMNLVLAFVLMWGLYTVGMPVEVYKHQPAVVAGVLPASPAEKAGLRVGDRIVSVGGDAVRDWDGAIASPAIVPGEDVAVDVQRDGKLVPLKVSVPRDLSDACMVLGCPRENVTIESVQKGEPADKAGMKPGDEIVSANDVPATNREILSALIQESKGAPIRFVVKRGRRTIPLAFSAAFTNPGDGVKRWAIGISFGQVDTTRESYPLAEAAVQSWKESVGMTKAIGSVGAGLFSGRVSIKDLAGPVGIVQMSSRAAQLGAAQFLEFMAFISLQLGLLNLLPIPILDGGRILVMAIEGSIRRDLSVRMQERLLTVGLVFILAVFGFVMYYDIARLFPNH